MTERELRRRAYRIWLTARPPRWYLYAVIFLVATFVAIMAVFLATIESDPTWFPPAADVYLWVTIALLVAGFADSYRRILRDLKRHEGGTSTS